MYTPTQHISQHTLSQLEANEDESIVSKCINIKFILESMFDASLISRDSLVLDALGLSILTSVVNTMDLTLTKRNVRDNTISHQSSR